MNYKLLVARKEKRLYQRELAEKLGIHPQTYHEKEVGKKDFTLTEAKILAKTFHCTLDDLFGGDESELGVS